MTKENETAILRILKSLLTLLEPKTITIYQNIGQMCQQVGQRIDPLIRREYSLDHRIHVPESEKRIILKATLNCLNRLWRLMSPTMRIALVLRLDVLRGGIQSPMSVMPLALPT